ncbi:hypothetical protein ACFCYH_37390 [Streptomyces sp. NPDC056400]|uniref:hypothetical protein n=1 Tax=Streptomyces sp. NPDC056400 TaxID=3345808 RepID=UPI0035DB0B12
MIASLGPSPLHDRTCDSRPASARLSSAEIVKDGAYERPMDVFDLVVVDEAHRMSGPNVVQPSTS